ncbi:hypothetical protein [Aureliella helgolandensis]|nr:hypothetical protein [Aureliella helgolandensis]
MLTIRNALLIVAVFVVVGFFVADRIRLSNEFEIHKKEAFQDSLKRQFAVVKRNRAMLIENFIVATKKKGMTALDGYFFALTSAELVDIWEHERDIDEGRCERATVSAKRILQSLDCGQTKDYLDFARRIVGDYLEDKTGNREFDDVTLVDFLGLQASDDLENFRDFMTRACEDSVARGDDFESDFDSRLQNAPAGEYRLF